MPPPATPPAPIRVDRQAEYQIILGESLKQSSSSFSSLKYNHKPPTIVLNPSAPRLTQTSSGYNLSFVPPAQKEGKTAPREVVYSATTSTPSQKAQHFLLFDNDTKKFTLERLDAAFVFNAEVYTKLHPALKVEGSDNAESSAGSGSEEDDEEAAVGIYDYRQFLGRTSAAEEKRQKRLGALKRAGKEVVDIPEPEEDASEDGEVFIPDAVPPPPVEEDSDMDAPGESDDEMVEPLPPPPPPPPPPAKKKAAPKPKAKAPPKPRAPSKKKSLAPPPPLLPPVDEIVLPDPEPVVDSDEEEVEFSDEDEEISPPAGSQPSAPTPAPPADEPEEPEIDFDFEKELEEALGSGDDHTKAPPVGLGLVVEEDDTSDEDDDQPGLAPLPIGAGGGAPKSLRELYGGAPEEEEEDSESEEE